MADPKVNLKIGASTDELFSGLKTATAGFKSFANDINAQAKGVTTSFQNMMAPLAAIAGLVGGTAFLKSTVNDTKDWVVESQKLARVLGTTTEEASVFGVAIEKVHGDSEEFLGIAAKMTKTLNTNEGAFHKLGIATRDSNGHLRNTGQVLLDAFDTLSKFKIGTDRNVASTQLFGKSWLEVQKYLALNKTVMAEARDQAQKLNLIVGQDAVEATNRYRHSQDDLDLSLKGMKITIGTQLMPVLTALNQDLTENGPQAVSALGSAFQWAYQVVYTLREEFEYLIVAIRTVVKDAINSFATMWAVAKASLTSNFVGIKAALKKFEDDRTKLLQEATDDRLEIENRYAEKTMKLMGLGPKAKPQTLNTSGKTAETKEQHEKENQFAQDKLKLEIEAVHLRDQETLAQKEKVKLDLEDLRMAGEKLNLQKQLTAGTLTKKQYDELADTAQKQHGQAMLNILTETDEERQKLNKKTLDEIAIQELEGSEKLIEEAKQRFAAINEERVKAGLIAINDAVLQNEIISIKTKEMLRKLKEEEKADNKWEELISRPLEHAFDSALMVILTKHKSFAQEMKAVYKDLANGIMQVFTQMAAKEAAQWVARQAIHAWHMVAGQAEISLEGAKSAAKIQGATASTTAATTEATASTTATTANVGQATSGFFASFAGIPFVGLGLALAAIAAMMAVMKTVTAHAVGGLIDRPTMSLMGEAGPEFVMPEKSAKDYMMQVYQDVKARENNIQNYSRASYIPQTQDGNSGTYGNHTHLHLEGAVIAGQNQESARIIGNLVNQHMNTYNRRNA